MLPIGPLPGHVAARTCPCGSIAKGMHRHRVLLWWVTPTQNRKVLSTQPSLLVISFFIKSCGPIVVANHGVAEDLIEQTFEENRKFFALPEASKREILADKNNRCGLLAASMSLSLSFGQAPYHMSLPKHST